MEENKTLESLKQNAAVFGLTPQQIQSNFDRAIKESVKAGVSPMEVASAPTITIPPATNRAQQTQSNLGMLINAGLSSTSSEKDIVSAIGAPTASEQRQMGFLESLSDLYQKRTGRAKEGARLAEEFKVDEMSIQLNNLNKEIAQEQRALDLETRRLEKNPEGKFASAVNEEINRVRGESLQRQADLAIIKAGVQGDITTYSNLIQQKLDLKFAPIEEEIQNYENLLNLERQIGGILDGGEKQQLEFILDERTNRLREEKNQEEIRNKLAAQVAQTNPSLARQIISGQMSLEEAYIQSGQAAGQAETMPSLISKEEFIKQKETAALQSLPREQLNRDYDAYVKQTFFDSGRIKFTATEYKKLLANNLINSDLQTQLNFLYKEKSKEEEIVNPF